MKKYVLLLILSFPLLINGYSQSTNDILNVLVQKRLVSQEEADSLRADAAIKEQESVAKKKNFPVTSSKLIQISGFTQIRFQNQEQAGKKSGFDIRRARLDVKGNISPYFGYRIVPEFAGSSARLLDAYAEIRLSGLFNLTIGQQKIALSRENQESDNKYDFIDRSQVIEALTHRSTDPVGLVNNNGTITNNNGRDIGIQANGGLFRVEDRNIIEYWVGIYNGSGINVGETNKTKDVSGRLVLQPVQGLYLGGSFYNGVGYYGTPLSNHGRTRWGAEIKWKIRDFFIQAEYLKGKDVPVTKEGYYAEAGYFILPQKLQLLVKYDLYDPDKSVGKNISTIHTGGVNYSFNSSTRLLLAYNARQKQGGGPNTNYAAAQFLISF